MAWLDTGTHESLLEASNYVAAIEHRQGLKVACLEEIAFTMGFLTAPELRERMGKLPKNDYYRYLETVLQEQGG